MRRSGSARIRLSLMAGYQRVGIQQNDCANPREPGAQACRGGGGDRGAMIARKRRAGAIQRARAKMLKLADKTPGNVRAIASSALGRVNSLAHLYTRARPPHRAAPAAGAAELEVGGRRRQPAGSPTARTRLRRGRAPDFSCAIPLVGGRRSALCKDSMIMQSSKPSNSDF